MTESISDLFDLQRFLVAQEQIFERAMEELRQGRKRSHWMWFIFPQLRSLGRSPLALHFGIGGIDEARAYLDHQVLGPHLEMAARIAIDSPAPSLFALFGTPDDLKFCSSMTLFEAVGEPGAPFTEALERRCLGKRDQSTLSLLANAEKHRPVSSES